MIETGLAIPTLEEVSAFLRVTKRPLYRFVQDGQLSALTLGGAWRFRREELNQWTAESIGMLRGEGS